mgnify:CR=1 FL=1
MKLFKKDEYNVGMIVLIIALIILFIPVLLTQPAPFNFLNFTNKGQIGDTIGGLTSPFLNGLAAILIYIAFKEQVKANTNFMNMEERKIIIEQINYIQNYNIVKDVQDFNNLIETIGLKANKEFEYVCGRLKIILSDIEDIESQINKFGGEKESLKMRLKNIVREIYVSQLYDLSTNFHAEGKIESEYIELVNEVNAKKDKVTSLFLD